jgi:hypothetical protein
VIAHCQLYFKEKDMKGKNVGTGEATVDDVTIKGVSGASLDPVDKG